MGEIGIRLSKLKFEAPRRSKPHLALRSAISRAGLNEEALRDLLWLLNANPSLVAYGRVFSHLEYLLSSHVFRAESLRWTKQPWPERLSDWLAICSWVRINLATLTGQQGLREFERVAGRVHPHMGTGITRHGVAGILWLQHEEVGSHGYPLPMDRPYPVASRYFELQAHILAVYLDCRSKLSTRDFYEQYDGERETPLAPVLAASFSPGVREFSLNTYAFIVATLPHALNTEAYARSIRQLDAKSISHTGEVERLARNYLRDVQTLFDRFLKVLGGWKPSESSRAGRSGGGGRSRKHGYVETLGGAGFYTTPLDHQARDLTDEKITTKLTVLATKRDSSEEAFIGAPIRPIFIAGLGGNKGSIRNARKESETGGLAPGEDTEHLFNLYLPNEIGKRFLALRFQRLAIEMKAQRFMFDFNQLTDQELDEIWRMADEAIIRYLENPAPLNEKQALAIAGMTVKLSLSFGQPWDTVHRFKIVNAESLGQLEQLSVDDDEIERALMFVRPISGCWLEATFKGLRLPGICPHYQTEMPASLEELDPHYAFGFVLPDYIGLGEQLCALLERLPPLGERWNPLNEDALLKGLRLLFGKADTTRISLNAISQVTPSLLYGATQDPTLEWVTFGMESRSDEPRMFYTRHPVHRIRKAFRGASIRLRRILNVRSPIPAIVESIGDEHYSVGARFVLPKHSLTKIVMGLQHYLTRQDLDLSNPTTRMSYHNHYVLYVVLVQGLVTTVRLTSRLNTLFKTWQNHHFLDLPYEKWLRNDTHAVYRNASVSDKETEYCEKTRLTRLSPILIKQFEFLEEHDRTAVDLQGIKLGRNPESVAIQPFFWLDESLTWNPVSPGWVADMLEAMTEYPIPSNFHRAYVRNHLLDANCPPEQIDFHMGHGDLGERATTTYSTFEFDRHLREMAPFISLMLSELGVSPVRSRFAELVAT